MADENLVALLRKGVTAWNAWREPRPWARIDLVEANLSKVNLSEVNLRKADLSGADLSRASLILADLSGAAPSMADLRQADISNADLRDSNLRSVHLTGANLSGASLRRANLTGATLGQANLRKADFRMANLGMADFRWACLYGTLLSQVSIGGAILESAQLSETVVGDVDLSKVTGLESCIHHGPSIIDFQTLQRSGPLPLAFLRGVGLPDSLIDYLPSLLNQPIQMYSCFISYSHKDEAFAQRLHADLQNKGVRCWFAPHDLPIGAKIWDTIDEAIKLRDKLLLILSDHSIASDWVEDEVSRAFAEERERKTLVLFPVRIDDAVLSTPEPWARKLRDQRHIGDFRKWKDHDEYQKESNYAATRPHYAKNLELDSCLRIRAWVGTSCAAQWLRSFDSLALMRVIHCFP